MLLQHSAKSKPACLLPPGLPPGPALADPSWEQLAEEVWNGWGPPAWHPSRALSVDVGLRDGSFAPDTPSPPGFRQQDGGQEERDKAHEGGWGWLQAPRCPNETWKGRRTSAAGAEFSEPLALVNTLTSANLQIKISSCSLFLPHNLLVCTLSLGCALQCVLVILV